MSKFLLILFSWILVFSNGLYCQSNPNFLVFDGMMIKDKPNLSNKSFSMINIVYEDSLLVSNNRFPKNGNRRVVDKQKLRRSSVRINSNYPTCLDVESWTLYSDDLDQNLSKYYKVMSDFKSIGNYKDIGFFGVLPYGNVYKYDSRFNKIAKVSSIAYPVFYTKSDDKTLWLKDVEKQILIIKKNWPNLKVYAFIWPQYHTNDQKMKGKYIKRDFWRFQLEELYKRCDGVVVWMPPFNLQDRSPISWNNNAPWYIETLEFIAKNRVKH